MIHSLLLAMLLSMAFVATGYATWVIYRDKPWRREDEPIGGFIPGKQLDQWLWQDKKASRKEVK